VCRIIAGDVARLKHASFRVVTQFEIGAHVLTAGCPLDTPTMRSLQATKFKLSHYHRIDHLDFLFGEPSFVNRLDPSKTEKKSFIIDADGLELANKLQQKRVAKECADWIERKVDIKTIKQSNLLHGKMYYVATAGVEEAILGSSNFTVRGLGLGNGNNNLELNLIVDGNRDRQELKQWFDELWSHPNLVKGKVPGRHWQNRRRTGSDQPV
jgi:phosphatidylserine/phosphatidylglycerophosphate/cardiolipin synthase-like enzyme